MKNFKSPEHRKRFEELKKEHPGYDEDALYKWHGEALPGKEEATLDRLLREKDKKGTK